MPQGDDRDIVIVSDLHMSAGYDRRTGTFNRNEDFFYDGAFARFLEHLRARAEAEDRKWRLLILGDLFDFLQVELQPRASAEEKLDRSEAVTLAKLDRIAQGHPEFFRALGCFVAAGFPIDVVPGNHDVEMIRPSAQEHFKRLVAEQSGRPEAAAGITFYPWIYYVPGVLYAEHGQQYDETNSFATMLQPYVDPAHPDEIDLPLGSYFVEYVFNRIEAIDPFADNVKPATRYLFWALQNHPVRGLSTLGAHMGLFMAVLNNSKDLTPDEEAARRAAYHRDVLRPYAAELGLRYETVAAIDELAAEPAMTNKLLQLQALIVKPLARLIPVVGALAVIYLTLRRMRRTLRSFALFSTGVLALIWRERRALRPATEPGNYLLRAATGINQLLDAERKAVPLYVFGHTHTPEQFPLTTDEHAPRYVNSGTWTPVVPSAFDLLGGRERFTFVQVIRDRDGGPPVSSLMVWNDVAARPEVLPLFTA